mgnify:CR=1 FL=1
MSGILLSQTAAFAQYRTEKSKAEEQKTEAQLILEEADSSEAPVVITLEQALEIALSENVSVKVADMEIQRTQYAKKGSYASLFPQIDVTGAYQRTIKKQVMYMDFDMGSMGGALGGGEGSEGGETQLPDGVEIPDAGSGDAAAGAGVDMSGGLEVGRWNTWSAGVSAAMPLVNAQLWKSIKISGLDVELAVEKARSSRLEMVNQVKQAYFSCLLSKEAFNVYKSVYENALENFNQTQRKYNVQKASDLDLARAKTALANAVPNVYNAESSVILALWQLKAVMGISLDENIDVVGELSDYSKDMLYDLGASSELDLTNNTTMRQLAIQAEQLATAVKTQQMAYLPSLAVSFSYSVNAMTNDFNFSEYKWSPHSFVGLSLQIPIFSGGKRYHAVKQAKVQAAELDVQKLNTERQLKIAIRQYLNQMETAMKSFASAESALESAQKAYDIAQKSYNVGKSTLTDLNDAQLALTQAQLAQSQAVYNFLNAKAQLEQTIGQDFTAE